MNSFEFTYRLIKEIKTDRSDRSGDLDKLESKFPDLQVTNNDILQILSHSLMGPYPGDIPKYGQLLINPLHELIPLCY